MLLSYNIKSRLSYKTKKEYIVQNTYRTFYYNSGYFSNNNLLLYGAMRVDSHC